MNFILSSQNVVRYLVERKICDAEKQELDRIEQRSSKNFNLLVSFTDGSRFLVKQERRDRQGKTRNDFEDEWRIHELYQKFSELSELNVIRPLLSEAICFDADNSIIVFKYLDEYTDLGDFYAKEKSYSTAIAFSIGTSLATIHRATIDSQQYRNFLVPDWEESPSDRIPNFLRGLGRLTPEIFGSVISDGIQFFQLYQLYDSLEQAIVELNAAFVPCCLTHNDLKLDNVLLYEKWETANSQVEPASSIIRLIDWEHSDWGDPAYDLGIAVSSYIRIWLRSLVVSADIDLETSLQLAATPLEQLQPSIAALIRGYCTQFPEIIASRPDFLQRVMQFAGLGTIRRIQANLQYKESFDNTGICMLQVAKTLLCYPDKSISTICGVEASELLRAEGKGQKATGVIKTQKPDDIPHDLWAALQDIANRVVIESNFCIRHPNYEPWKLPTITLNRIQQLPANLQQKCLSLQLRSFLYRTYYNGSIQPISATQRNNSNVGQNLENDTSFGVDIEFYERLHQSNSGEGYFNGGWQAIAEDNDDSLIVNKDGLTLYIDRDFHLQSADRSATVGDIVTIRFPKNRIQTGFYMAIGNAGRNNRHNSPDGQLVRVYFNFSPEGAVAVMGSLTRHLNELYIPFSFKVLYNPSEYDRYDSGVLYFDKSHYPAVHSKLKQIYTEHQSHFQPSIPLFTKFLASGLGLAEEPERLLSRKESFGLNRCQIIADGLLDSWQQDDNPDSRIAAVRQRFSSLGIKLSHAYLNANSADIYTPLKETAGKKAEEAEGAEGAEEEKNQLSTISQQLTTNN